jgi:small conductance mechanosensitive channel
MNDHLETVAQVKSTVIDLAVKFGPKVFVAIVILAVGFFVGRWVGRGTNRMLTKLQLEVPIRQLLVRIVRVLVLGLFLIMALQNLGVELLPLIAGIGLAGAGIALAMQGVLSNLAAGLTIIFTRPFRVGEYISIVGVEGKVEAIHLFNTTLSHTDLSKVVIPNRKIVGEILHNYGQIRQLELTVGVAYDTELNQALAVIQEVVQDNPRVLKDPAPVIQVVLLGDFAVNIGVRPWAKIADYGAALGELNQAIVETFRGRDIVIPFPQHDVRILGNAPVVGAM